TQAMSRVRQAFGVEVPLRALFEGPTVAELARVVEAGLADLATAGPEAPPLVPMPAAMRAGELPLSFAQQRLWFLDRLVPDNPFYNMFGAVRLAGPVDVPALREACREIARRHEVLRTTFPSVAGRPVQAIAAEPPPGFPLIELGGLPEAPRREELERLANAEGRRPFDLTRGPVFRAALLRLGEAEHSLFFNLHHIVSDGWSLGVLHRDLAVLYGAFHRRQLSPLPELPVQYADFAVWQRGWLQGEALRARLDYWRGQLEGMPEVLELPTDRPRPAIESFRGAGAPFPLAAPLVRRLSLLARRRGATLSMVVLAGFKALLARLSGRGDVPVGVAIAGRNRRETEELIGFFVNTLVLRTQVSGSAGSVGAGGFGDLVARVRETSLGAYAHQDLPFEKLVEELAPDRDLGRNPLVQVTFGFHNFPRREVETGGLVLIPPSEEAVGTGTSKFDLSLHLFEADGALQGTLEYNLDLFDEPTARRFTGHLATLLAAAVEDPEVEPALLPLLSEAESHQLLTAWNDTASPYERDLTVHEVFDLQVEARPDAVAVIAGDEHLTYLGLARRARRLAADLRALGVGPEEVVGLRAERSAGLPAAMLGILYAGAAYLPLDPEAPEERLALMREEAGVRFVVSGGAVMPPAAPGQEGGSPSSLAYVIYTSGSTGRPKGVAVPHRGIVRLVRQAGYARLDADETLLQVAPVSFDASTFEIWGALLNGGRLVMMPPEKPTLDGIGDALARHGVTTLHLTAGLFHAMVEERLGALAGLRQLLTGGDVLSAPHVRRAAASLPHCQVIACYGPTEGTTFTSVHLIDPNGAGHLDTSVPLGRPIGNTRVLVLDRSLLPVPVGVAGDLAVGGDGLARGYLGRPDLTAERFVPDPYPGDSPGGRLYLTGDRVRHLADGTLEFLGRFDTQVKVRGFRVEPAEVEAHLAEHPAVRASAVLAHEEERGDRRLVAYVVPDPEYAAAGGDSGGEAAARQVEAWTRIFDDTYRADVPDATFNTVGWVSTATGLPLSREEMGEWAEDAVDRILALAPRRVLEIGCGTGLLLFPIAPHCEQYTGTDISPRVLASLAEHLGDLGSRVRLLERPADRFDGIEDESLDLVILNSVVQYFPDADYLATVLERAVAAVRPGGAVFLGDVRSLPLLDAFYASVELAQAEPGCPASRIRRRAETRRLQENELVVAPAFFAELARRLPGICRVEVHPKRGRAHNELTAFRYQVVLRVGEKPPSVEIPWRDWREGMTLESLRRLLAGPDTLETAPLGIRNIPNARSASHGVAAALLLQEETLDAAGLLARAGEAVRGAVDPQDLWDLGRGLGWQVDLGWADPGAEGRFEAVFRRPSPGEEPVSLLLPSPPAPPESRPWSAYTNDPLRGQLARRLAPELRAFLGTRLPDYMLPAAFVPLEAMPLTPNGKLDHRALARLGLAADLSQGADRYAAPRTPTEERLAAIWADLLKVPRVGAEDDFFTLGGHSLLATQAVSRVRDAFGVELPLRALFEAPTVAGLAAVIDSAREADPGLALPPIERVPRDRPLPLSFAQQRLWFLDRLVPDNPFYNMFSAVRLAGALDVAALRGACREITRRHEVLRTTFEGASGQPFQVIHPEPAAALTGILPLIDLGGLPEAARPAELERLAAAEGRRPFDLQGGPVFRNALVRLAEAEHSLFLNIHHIAADGWSMGILHRELAALYEAFARSRSSPLPELPIQYADFAVWQRG
ncbi:MAG TPA: amino acid adenylation domain-containing protein, partial [Thermoanaerobaculia bacterium]|nr:amino acid adenylation domain-containing protein [Thermoanaerobaculia bacterium]